MRLWCDSLETGICVARGGRETYQELRDRFEAAAERLAIDAIEQVYLSVHKTVDEIANRQVRGIVYPGSLGVGRLQAQ